MIPMIGPSQGSAALPSSAFAPEHRALVDDHDLHLDAAAPEHPRLPGDALRLVEEDEPRGGIGADELRRRPDRGTDHADAHAVDPEHGRAVEPVRRLTGGLVDDVRREEREVGPLDVLEQPLAGRSRTRGCRAPWRPCPTRSRRRSPACPRAAPSSAATHRRCHRPTAAASGPAGRTPPRRTSSRAAARRRRVTLRPSIERRRLLELTVEVVQPDDRQRLVLPAPVEQVAPHDALAVAAARARRAGTPPSGRGRCCARPRRRRARWPRRRRGTSRACSCCSSGPAGPARSRAGRRTPSARSACPASPHRTGTAAPRTRRGRRCASGAPCRRRPRRAVRDVARLGLREGAVDHLPALRGCRRRSSRSGPPGRGRRP